MRNLIDAISPPFSIQRHNFKLTTAKGKKKFVSRRHTISYVPFYILGTALHLGTILINNQLDAQFLLYTKVVRKVKNVCVYNPRS
jgi:hypothetical protein